MIATVTILETNFEVEWDFNITAHGNGGCAPSLSYPGDPPEPAEFDITILGIEGPQKYGDAALEIPAWLSDLIATHLYERDDINTIVQEADQDSDYDCDPDYERDVVEAGAGGIK
jgi:hypothetical protein